ncbi:Ras- protein Rab-4A [Lobulomyces angularis]|nr:Ras- protein Rab-4A [Lobulomyces angularis]
MSSGKSCLLRRFIDGKFKSASVHTVGIEFGSKIINLTNKIVKLQIWDSAGQERFRAVTKSYWRGAAGCLLVYGESFYNDITDMNSFKSIQSWLDDARNLASKDAVMLLVGNKLDLEEYREVSYIEASNFAQVNNLMFLEASALTGEMVEEIFFKITRTILSKIETGEIDPNNIGTGNF